MKTSLHLLFHLKKSKNYESGPIPIYLRITVNGDRVEVALNRKCEPEKWNNQKERAKGTKEETKELNAYLDDIQLKVFEVSRKMEEAQITLKHS